MKETKGSLKERLADVEETLKGLIETNISIPIIVEGGNDVKALRALGVNGEILKLNIGDSILQTCANIGKRYREVIILTDWDYKGGVLARQLKEKLGANGIKSNTDIRARFAVLCKKEIKDVQALEKYISKLRGMA